LCGSNTNLEVHHEQFRSHLGGDQEVNLVTVCLDCHSSIHGRPSGSGSRVVFFMVRPESGGRLPNRWTAGFGTLLLDPAVVEICAITTTYDKECAIAQPR